MKISDLAYALISAATKGANVASIIRSEDTLLQLLTEEKTGDQKNERFVQDFKTLADVLIQEMVRHDLDMKFPGLGENLFGEESSEFTNAIGETVNVEIKPSQQENYELLCQVLDHNTHAAQLLAKALNSNPEPPSDPKLDQITEEIDLSKIRIWIDPIDSTAQYIQGQKSKPDEHGVVYEGLQCVTVLIGVYQVDTGLPIAGVVFQPFHHQEEDSWKSRCLWGICYGDIKIHSYEKENHPSSSTKGEHGLIITSSSEDENVQEKLKEDFRLCYAAGVGYKTLCVLDHTVDAYLLSKGSTYHWDICAPHAILLAMGGGIVACKTALKNPTDDIKQLQIHYHLPKADAAKGINQWCNSNGVIAYRDITVLKKICSTIS